MTIKKIIMMLSYITTYFYVKNQLFTTLCKYIKRYRSTSLIWYIQYSCIQYKTHKKLYDDNFNFVVLHLFYLKMMMLYLKVVTERLSKKPTK